MLYRSRFAHYYQRGNSVALFHSLSQHILFGDTRLLYELRSFPLAGAEVQDSVGVTNCRSSAIEALRCKGLLVEGPDEDKRILDRLKGNGLDRHQGRVSLMYLIPSAACNLSCRYCFVDHFTPCYSQMSTATARRAVDYFFLQSAGSKSRKIIFYGGEPLLNFDAVLAAADRTRELENGAGADPRTSLVLITNGTLLDEAVADALVQRDIHVSVSIDGPASVHDRNRVTSGGEPTFSQATRAFEILRQKGMSPSVSCTVTEASLSAWERVVTFIKDELRPRGLGFNLLHPGPNPCQTLTYSEGQNPTNALLDAFQRFREAGIYEDRIMRRVQPFATRRFHYRDCLAVGGQIAVAPDGSIGPCQGLLGQSQYFPLDISRDFSKSPYSNRLFRDWATRVALNFDECQNCPAVSICGGGCPLVPLRQSGTIWSIDHTICPHIRQVHEWLVWDLYDHTMRAAAPSTDGTESTP